MDADLHARVRRHIVAMHNVPPETLDCLAVAGTALLLQVRSDLQAMETGPVVSAEDLYRALEARHLTAFAARLRALQNDERRAKKHARMLSLRKAGYGATSDHVTFVRNMFASQHEVLAPNLEVEESDSLD
jgi:hypothetical protein